MYAQCCMLRPYFQPKTTTTTRNRPIVAKNTVPPTWRGSSSSAAMQEAPTPAVIHASSAVSGRPRRVLSTPSGIASRMISAASTSDTRQRIASRSRVNESWRSTATSPAAVAPCAHGVDEAVDVGEAIVERHRRDTDHVRLAPVADHADRFEVLEERAAALAAAVDPQRQLAAAPFRFGRRHEV